MYHQLRYMQSNTLRKKLNRNMIKHLNINLMAILDTYKFMWYWCILWNKKNISKCLRWQEMLDIFNKKWCGWHCFSCDFHIHRRNFDAICIVTKENIVPYTMLLKISVQLPHEYSNLLQLIYNSTKKPQHHKIRTKLNLVLYFHISFIRFTTRQGDKSEKFWNLKACHLYFKNIISKAQVSIRCGHFYSTLYFLPLKNDEDETFHRQVFSNKHIILSTLQGGTVNIK